MSTKHVLWIAVITLATVRLAYMLSPTQATTTFGVSL